MNNYSNNKTHDPYGFKEVVKIKYDVVKAVAGRFPNRTAVMIELLAAVPPPIDCAGYCWLIPPKQLVWEERGDDQYKTIYFLMNLKNNNAKKDLRLGYSQGNLNAYLSTIELMTRYLSTQYLNKNSTNQQDGKKGDRRGKKGTIRNLKTRIVTRLAPQEHTLEIPHQMKSPSILAKEPV